MAPSKSSSTQSHHDKEIDALLNRLHTGCRFVDFEGDSNSRRKGGDGNGIKIANLLRNLSPPDETHAELGRALAHSYVGSLRSITSKLSQSSSLEDDSVQSAVERGEHIIKSLCCGEDVSSDGNSKYQPDRANYASAGYAFFGHLKSFYSSIEEEDAPLMAFIQSQWQNWCIQCEEYALPTEGIQSNNRGGGIHVLNSCLKNYGYICCFGGKGDGCAKVYMSLKHHSSRKCLIRILIEHAFSLSKSKVTWDATGLVDIVSPLFHSCVLSARKTTPQSVNYHAERQLILHDVLRGCSLLVDHNIMVVSNSASKGGEDTHVGSIANIIQYLTTSLTSYLNQSIYASFVKVARDSEDDPCLDIFELGYDWLRGICDLMTKLVSLKDESIVNNVVSRCIEVIITSILPQYTSAITTNFDMAPIYSTLVSCVDLLSKRKRPLSMDAKVVLRLGSMALNLRDEADVLLVCDLIYATFGCNSTNASSVFTGGILVTLGCIFRCRPACFDKATFLVQLGNSIIQSSGSQKYEKGQVDGKHLMNIIVGSLGSDFFQPLMDIISTSVSDVCSTPSSLNIWQRRSLCLSDQCSGLLLGLSLLHISISPSQTMVKLDDAFAFIQTFLVCYPRLASRVVPSVIDITRTLMSSQSSTIEPIMSLAPLGFLASPCIVSDPHGAHLTWTYLSSLIKDTPTPVRSTVIRLLPDMCSSNKRLFRRVRDVIGKSIGSQDPVIRISATSALAHMARLDLLRDVEQIVGWVQNRLMDEEPAVVYYALETLRYLVVNEELEFDLVIRVLEKRLNVDLSDVQAVLGLDKLALESLFALLGEGGLEEEDDDEDDQSNDVEGPAVSPQSMKAVALLVELAQCPQLSAMDGTRQNESEDLFSSTRLQGKIHGSLASYSPQILGLEEETIRSWDGANNLAEDSEEMDPDVDRYVRLKDIVLAGFESIAQISSMIGNNNMVEELASGLSDSAMELGKTLLKFEEDCFGSFLFRGGVVSSSDKTSKGKSDRTKVSKATFASLPAASRIRDLFETDPRSASAIALLFSIGSDPNELLQTESILAQISECFGDIESEPLVDPAFQAMKICALMHCMNVVWKSIQEAEHGGREELLDQVVAQAEEWATSYGGEVAYIAMAAFALSVDESAQCWAGVTSIHNTILQGRYNYLFESEDTKLLCLSMIAARLSRTADARVTGIVDTIEQSLSDHSRHTCFGAFFGLGVIVENLMKGNIQGTDPSDLWRRELSQRIICILLLAFNSSLTQENEAVLGLITSIKSCEVTNDLSQECSRLDSLSIQDDCAPKMKAILIGLSHTFPVISVISDSLLNCVICVFNKLPWGSGKGFVLHGAYKTALESGVLSQKDVSEAILATSSFIEESCNNTGDALLCLASLCRISSEKSRAKELDLVVKICKEVLTGQVKHSVGEDKLMSILACCAAVGELPGLTSFTSNIHPAVKKTFVVDIVTMLDEIVLSDLEELKYKDASTIGLGILSSMARLSQSHNQTQKNTSNKFESIQAKEGSLLQGIFQEVEKSYSLLCSGSSRDRSRSGVVNKLCALFSSLEHIALPGSFSRVIELTLNDSSSDDLKLKDSLLELLVTQLEGRRRIGYDGRGFVDLFNRLAKMPSAELHSLVGPNAVTIMMKAFPNLIYQIPTSSGEDVARCLWTICLANFKITSSSQCTAQFLVGMKILLERSGNEEGKSGSKQSISPALLRTLQKFLVSDIFSDLCRDAVPLAEVSTEDIWSEYLQCLQQLVPSTLFAESFGPSSGDIEQSKVFGMATSAKLSPKSTRKVESWIARQNDLSGLQVLLLSTLALATQARNDIEMKESVLAIFDVMVVKGIDTMAVYVLAAKIAFWWESRQMHQIQHLEMPIQHISNLSYLLVTKNLSFKVHTMSADMLSKLFDTFIGDLPSKLAVLCKLWGVSDDVSNRALRIWNANFRGDKMKGHRFLSCIKDIIQLVDGGEMPDDV